MKLYSYQENAVLAVESDPSHSQLISMPTGTGKTITFLSLAKRSKKKCLILVHRTELLTQTYEKAKLIGYETNEISLITSEDKQAMSLLSIAMVPTLIRNLEKYDPKDVEMMIIDEAHHSTADSYKKIISYFRIFEDKKTLLGFTATPLRGDSQVLSSIYHSHSFKMTLAEATQNGYICPVHGMRIEIDKALDEIQSCAGDYDSKQLDSVMNCDAINNLIASRCEHLHRTPALIFCTSVDHASKINNLLLAKGKKSVCVSYLTPKKDLEVVFSQLAKGEIDFITNAVKLSEGFDHPPIQSIIIARPTRSPVLYKQMIGRGLRKHPGKYDCFVLEFSGSDPKMICWEDIDNNCTFQSSTLEEKTSRDAALNFYKYKWGNIHIKILDVRVSSFSFYECKIRRFCTYAKFYRYIPFTEGFLVGEIRSNPNGPKGLSGHRMYAYVCIWKIPFKSFFVWDGGCELADLPGKKAPPKDMVHCYEIPQLELHLKHYADFQPDVMGKWYPSEEEPATMKQKSYFTKIEKMSARKAEFFLEDCAIKKALKLYWINQKMPNFDGNNRGTLEMLENDVIYELPGVY